MTNDKLADEIEQKLGEGHWDSIGLEHDKWAQIIAALRAPCSYVVKGDEGTSHCSLAKRPQSGEMVMVPMEPTEAMMKSADKALWQQMKSSEPSEHNDRPICLAVYRAMLAAAEAERGKM